MVSRKIERISIDRISSCKNFSCNNMSLDNYIKNTAYGDTISFDATTSLVIQDEEVVVFLH